LIPAVRRAVGDRIVLLADGNSCYTPRRAIEVGRLMEAQEYCHFEEPCPYWELEWTAEVAAALRMPVAGGEQDNDLAQWRRMIRMNAVDIVQPDLCYIGGLTRALRVAMAAHEAGKPASPIRRTSPGSPSSPSTCSVRSQMPAPRRVHHRGVALDRGVYDPPLRVIDGKVAIPDGPGWA